MLTKRREDRELMSITFDLDPGDQVTEVLACRVLLDGAEVPGLRADQPAAEPEGATVEFWVAAGTTRGLHRVELRVRTAHGRVLTAKDASKKLFPLMVE